MLLRHRCVCGQYGPVWILSCWAGGGGGGGLRVSLYSDVQVEQVGTYWGRGLGTVCLYGEGAREGGGEGVSGALPRDHPYEQKGWKHYLSATSLAGGNKYNVIIIMQRQKANWKGSRNREHILQKRHRRSLKSWRSRRTSYWTSPCHAGNSYRLLQLSDQGVFHSVLIWGH